MDRNKAKGMLWGLVVGDAFGSPIQFSGMDSHPWITEMVACPVFGLPPGYWTGNGSIMRFAPSYLLAQKEGDPAKVMHEISDLTHSSSVVRSVCDRFASVLDEHMAGRRTHTGPGKEIRREFVDNSGWAVSTLQAALWAFNTTESFEEGLIAAVNLGGDSDSIGAVFGQIAGAFYGFAAIPERWVKAVKTWEKVDALSERFLDTVEG